MHYNTGRSIRTVIGIPLKKLKYELSEKSYILCVRRFVYTTSKAYLAKVNGVKHLLIREDFLDDYIKWMERKGLIPKR